MFIKLNLDVSCKQENDHRSKGDSPTLSLALKISPPLIHPSKTQ